MSGSPLAPAGGADAPAAVPAGETSETHGPRDAGTNARDPGAADAAMSTPGRAPDLEHRFEPVVLAANEERTALCQSWTLDNDEALYVNRVVSTNEGAFHHSNWIWVDDQSYPGPDGTWPCAERGFEQVLAAAFGGVFFAQSTQATADTQAFPDGAAFEMPPHARIIGDVHLLNTAERERTTSLEFQLFTLPPDQVRVKLQPMAFTNTALEVAASGETRARMQCATPQPDFDIYYVLPHFHVLGQRMLLDVVGGDLDGDTIFTSAGGYGEPLGQTFDPPIAVRGAQGLGIRCDYLNQTGTARHYGFGSEEMCVVLIYSNGAKAGGTAITNVSADDTGGVHSTEAICVAVGT